MKLTDFSYSQTLGPEAACVKVDSRASVEFTDVSADDLNLLKRYAYTDCALVSTLNYDAYESVYPTVDQAITSCTTYAYSGVSAKNETKKSVKPNHKFSEIRNIDYNEEVGLVVVVFEDGEVIRKKMCPGDNFDLNVGIALCIADHIYGSNTQFHKEVRRLKATIDSKRKKKQKAKETKVND